MITAFEIAGTFAAHAVWSLSDGETLTPMLAYTTEEDERRMERLVHDELGAAVEHGKQRLTSNDMDANDAVLVYDGRITIDDEKHDALILEMRAYFEPDAAAILAVPYTPKASGQFRVDTPKLLAWENCDDFDLEHAFSSFFDGVAGHEKGAAIWAQSFDDSV